MVLKKHIKFIILTIFKCTVNCVKYIHIAVQQISRTFSSCKIERTLPQQLPVDPQPLVTTTLELDYFRHLK